ncbi:MAG: SHOCT domain-containing protein [Lactococcus cremoris]
MTNQPLNSSDQSKILIFALLLAPSVVFGVGAIPALFIGFGVFMLKKHEDFSHVQTAARNSKAYISLLLTGCILAAVYFGSTYGNPDHTSSYGRWYNEDEFIVSLVFSGIALTYIILINILFLKPLVSHSEWVEKNGIFSSRSKSAISEPKHSDVDIIKGEKLKQYSVADELTKWAKLKEDGHISESEFNEARAKLLRRN